MIFDSKFFHLQSSTFSFKSSNNLLHRVVRANASYWMTQVFLHKICITSNYFPHGTFYHTTCNGKPKISDWFIHSFHSFLAKTSFRLLQNLSCYTQCKPQYIAVKMIQQYNRVVFVCLRLHNSVSISSSNHSFSARHWEFRIKLNNIQVDIIAVAHGIGELHGEISETKLKTDGKFDWNFSIC